MKKSIMLLIAIILGCTAVMSQEKSVPTPSTEAVTTVDVLSQDATAVQLLDKYAIKLTAAIGRMEQPAKQVFEQLVRRQVVSAYVVLGILLFVFMVSVLYFFTHKWTADINSGTDVAKIACLIIALGSILAFFIILPDKIGTIIAPEWSAIEYLINSVK